jgi:hypothetical protein
VQIEPHPGALAFAAGKIPTPLGPVLVDWKNGETFQLSLQLPPVMSAKLKLPASENSSGVFSDGQPVAAHRVGARWVLDDAVSGNLNFEVR